ncbi:hypothetical protein TYRP_007662 [Tyrophagus putrescentiae]|nr:hypothetical protein TYRP_007662 [Tyrophagus putrescentiae]
MTLDPTLREECAVVLVVVLVLLKLKEESKQTAAVFIRTAEAHSLSSTTAASVPIVSTERQHLSQVKALVVHLINSQTAAAAPSTVGVSSSAAAVTASVKGTSLHNNLNSLPTSITGTLLNSAPASVNSSVSSSSLSAISSLCTDHQTFWDRSVGACVKCSSACPANAYVERQCNRTHDLECTCHKGWYMSVVDRTCKPCAQCPNGWGVWRTCRWSRNTVCRKCQPGTYSGSNVGTLGCIPCSKCGPNQDRATLRANFSQYFPELAERSSISASLLNQLNAEVGLLEQDEQNRAASAMSSSSSSPSYRHLHHHQHRNHPSSPYSTKTPTSANSGGGGLGGQNAMPFYFAILVIVVFSVCIYALVQLRCSEVLITGRSLEGACRGAAANGGRGHGGATAFLTTQAEQKAQLMMADSGFGAGPGSAVMIPQVVTTINSPYYSHDYSHLSHLHRQSSYQHAPLYGHHHYGNNNGGQPNYQNWNGNIGQEQPHAQPSSFSTVMHLYTASAQRQQTASSDIQSQFKPQELRPRTPDNSFVGPFIHHHKAFNPRPKPTYKAYYELLFAPEDMREENEEREVNSVINSLVEKLATDFISWRMLAPQLGYDDKQMAQLERKSTPTTAAPTSEQQPSNRTKVTSEVDENEEARKTVIHDLLTDWCRRQMGDQAQMSTEAVEAVDLLWPVSTLQRALTAIGRVDCARLLQQALNNESCSSSLSTSTSSCASTSSSSQTLS